jgi:short-subunit dehydrogenase
MPLPTPAADRTAVVTGASSGIGREIARELAGRGQGLTLVARRKERLDELAAELGGSSGVRVEVVAADLTDADARRGIAASVADRGLVASILVNGAGLSTVGPVHKADAEAELAMIRTDVEAVAHLCSLFLPGMVARSTGAVLNIASTAAFQPMPGQAGYGAAKAFVVSYSRALRAELRGTGVTMTVLCPGPVRTEFAEAAGFDAADAESALPKFMWVDATVVAKAAVDGLAQGRAQVVPGVANRATATIAPLLPANVLARVLASQHPGLRD